MNQLNIEERREGTFTVLVLTGPVNSYTFTEFQDRVYRTVRETDTAVDMEHVTTLSSAGLGALMVALEDAEAAGKKLWILKPSEIVRLAIESTGFSDRFPVTRTLKGLA